MTDRAPAFPRDCELLFTREQVERAVDDLAEQITARLAGDNPLVVAALMGGMVPFGMLLPRLRFALEVDYIHTTRYHNTTQGGELEWKAGPTVSARGRSVLLVDDILDAGETLAAVQARYRAEGARRVYKAVLVRKSCARPPRVEADFFGLRVPERYVFGYGMDFEGYWRNADGIYALAEDD